MEWWAPTLSIAPVKERSKVVKFPFLETPEERRKRLYRKDLMSKGESNTTSEEDEEGKGESNTTSEEMYTVTVKEDLDEYDP